MPEQPDNPPGRMLFTEFDVSDKGRPVAVLPPVQAPAPAPLHSITELASSLDFGFEDDEGDSPPPPGGDRADGENAAEAGGGETPPQSGYFLPPGEDQELVLDQPAARRMERDYPSVPVAAPTWEEYTKAFRLPRAQGRGDEAPAPPTAAFAATAGIRPAAGLHDVDSNAPTAAYPAVGDDDDVDILSALAFEGTEGAADAATRIIPREHAVQPPPATPYGGVERVEDWFNPPEDQPESPEVSDDWFEPPEEAVDRSADESDPEDDVDDLFDDELFAADGDDAGDDGQTRLMERPTLQDMSPADSIFDIFAGVDIDALWKERLESAGMQPEERQTDTRTVDFFSGIDLDELWEARTGQGQAENHTDRFPMVEEDVAAPDLNDTVIMDGDFADVMAESIGEIEADPLLEAGQEPNATEAEGGNGTLPPASQPAPRAGLPDDLDDLDALLEEVGSATAASVSAADATAGSFTEDAVEDDYAGEIDPDSYLDVMDEFDSGVHDVVAPSVDNSTIEGGAGGGKSRKAAVETPQAGPAQDREPAAPGQMDGKAESAADEAPGQFIGGGIGGGHSAADLAAAEAGTDGRPRVFAPPKRGLVTDDLLDIDFGDAAVNADVAAPVIDDSAIDPLQASAPRSNTEEMQAIVDGGEAAPVDPLDVFANMDDMDFSDDMDDDMRAMMEDEEDGADADADAGGDGLSAAGAARVEAPPKGLAGKARYYLMRAARRVLPMSVLEKLDRMVAWGDNWWFYCDLLAAIIASASLAVIISYYVWYRG